jgi:hypothetical protein
VWLKELDDGRVREARQRLKCRENFRFLLIESTALWHSILCGRLFSSAEFLRVLSI